MSLRKRKRMSCSPVLATWYRKKARRREIREARPQPSLATVRVRRESVKCLQKSG